MEQIIDLGKFIGKSEQALVGRDNGEAIKEKILASGIDFQKLEQLGGKIIVKIPTEVVSINKSFFLGLFELTIQRLGGAQNFFNKYEIDTTEHIKKKVRDHAEAAMLKASQRDILNG